MTKLPTPDEIMTLVMHGDAEQYEQALAAITTLYEAATRVDGLQKQRDAECERANRLAERIRWCCGKCMDEEFAASPSSLPPHQETAPTPENAKAVLRRAVNRAYDLGVLLLGGPLSDAKREEIVNDLAPLLAPAPLSGASSLGDTRRGIVCVYCEKIVGEYTDESQREALVEASKAHDVKCEAANAYRAAHGSAARGPDDAELLDRAIDLLDEVVTAHRDPNSGSSYNECEKPGEECLFCDLVRQIKTQRSGRVDK